MSLREFVRVRMFAPYKAIVGEAERQAYMRATPSPRLNLGCGGNRVTGWLNVDLFPPPGAIHMDASKRWPFEDASFDAILCEHMIEHVDKAFARHALGESLRVLKPGAPLRIVTPDMAFIARLAVGDLGPLDQAYLDMLRKFLQRSEMSACDAINEMFYNHGHRYIYTIEELRTLLESAGFVDLQLGRAAHPIDPIFEGVEGHIKEVGIEMDALEAFAFEARRPR